MSRLSLSRTRPAHPYRFAPSTTASVRDDVRADREVRILAWGQLVALACASMICALRVVIGLGERVSNSCALCAVIGIMIGIACADVAIEIASTKHARRPPPLSVSEEGTAGTPSRGNVPGGRL